MTSELPSPRVLLVEDEPLSVLVFQTSLEDGGFTVLTAGDGDEALAVLEEQGTKLHALITDVRLPGSLSGWDIARAARDRMPDLPVIYISGWTEGKTKANAVPGAILLEKPLKLSQFIETLKRALRCR